MAELAAYDYTYRDDGLIQSITEPAGVRNFTYDDTQQLTGGGFAAAPESYAYDAEGNRTSSHLSASYTHDDANRLLEDDSSCYAYDANGRVASITPSNQTPPPCPDARFASTSRSSGKIGRKRR